MNFDFPQSLRCLTKGQHKENTRVHNIRAVFSGCFASAFDFGRPFAVAMAASTAAGFAHCKARPLSAGASETTYRPRRAGIELAGDLAQPAGSFTNACVT
jgi:hypothetical protein